MQYNKYKTILEQVSYPQEAIVNAINEPTKSTTTLDYYNKNAKKFIVFARSICFYDQISLIYVRHYDR